MKCSKCGGEISKGEKFCQNCGTKIVLQDEKTNVLTNISSNENEVEKKLNLSDNQFDRELPKKESQNNSKKKKIVVIILVIIILIALGILVYYLINMNNDSSNRTNNDDSNDLNKNQLYIYTYRSSDVEEYVKILNEESDDDKYSLLGNYVCSSIDCHSGTKSADYYNSDYSNVVIYDDGYLLYNYETKEKTKLNINDIDTINLLKTNSNKNDYNGALVTKGEKENAKTAIYDLNHNKYVTDFDFIYDNFYYVDKDLLLAYTGYGKNSRVKVFSLKTLDVVNDLASEGPLSGQTSITKVPLKNTSKSIYSFENLKNGSKYLLDNVLNPWLNDISYNNYALNSDDSFTIKDNNNPNNYYIYNLDKEQTYKSKNYTAIIDLLTDYVIVNDNNVIKIVDYKEKNEYVLFKINNNMSFAYMTHNVLKDGYIDFFVLNEPNFEYFKDHEGTVYRFNFANKNISKQEKNMAIHEGDKVYKIN